MYSVLVMEYIESIATQIVEVAPVGDGLKLIFICLCGIVLPQSRLGVLGRHLSWFVYLPKQFFLW